MAPSVSFKMKMPDFDKLQKDFEDKINQAMDEYTEEVSQRWKEKAEMYLDTSKDPYLAGLSVEKIDMGCRVTLSGWLPVAVEQGIPAFDMKCIFGGYTRVLTSEGLKLIKYVKEGDLVLTHKGRFRKVLKTEYRKPIIGETIVDIRTNKSDRHGLRIRVSPEHGILTQRGWIQAGDLIPSDLIAISTVKCLGCNNPAKPNNLFCSRSCYTSHKNKTLAKEERHPAQQEKARKRQSIWAKELNKRFVQEGRFPLGTPECRKKARIGFNKWWNSRTEKQISDRAHKAAVALGKKSHGKTMPEEKFAEQLGKFAEVIFYKDWDKSERDVWIRQYLFKRDLLKPHRKTSVRNRWFFLDFYNPLAKLNIEIDGKRYHDAEKDAIRDQEIGKLGINILRIPSEEIYIATNKAEEIIRLASNDSHQYMVYYSPVIIEKKILNTNTQMVYDLQVEEDESFVCAGFVVHNSGLLGDRLSRIIPIGQRREFGKPADKFRTVSVNSPAGSWKHPGITARGIGQDIKEEMDDINKKVLSKINFGK